MTYAAASVLELGVRWLLDAQGLAYRLGVVQLTALVVSGVVAWALTRRALDVGFTYVLLGPLFGYALARTMMLCWPDQVWPPIVLLVTLVPAGMVAAGLLARAFARGPAVAVTGVAVLYTLWTGGVMAATFVQRPQSVHQAAVSLAQALAVDDPTGPHYVFGTLAHQLTLEGGGLPLFFRPSDVKHRALNERFLAFTPHPRYHLYDLPAQSLAELKATHALPEGLQGRVLGAYCLYPRGAYCSRPVLLVALNRFDSAALRRYVEDGSIPEQGG
jgi:hypothetical protein